MSFNFNPQPNFTNQGLQTASMHAPIVPSISNPAPGGFNFLTQNYWEGAVRINAGNDLIGESVGGDFTNFVCSFWAANLMPFFDETGTFGAFMPCFAADGPFQFFQPANSPHLSFGNFCILLAKDGAPYLFILNKANSQMLWSYPGQQNIMGWDQFDNPIVPLGVWHHYIFSYNSSTPRAQIIVDRGAVFNYLIGPSREAFSNPSNLDWKIVAPEKVLIDLAYFYFGTSDNFFDLTVPGNLDYFVSTSITPVNLGPAGRYVTPLTCRIMHTGNATNLFGVPEINPWQGFLNYPFSAVVSFEGKNYFSIFIGDNINNRPDISPDFWDIFTATTGFQFPYNAATGRLWGGVVEDAPTQPPTGA